ncbi:phosphoribosylglycinamide formyltransferase [Pelagibacterium xiamenense]|uniref:phosphoribosylglycinamide formyltransferase n=1 Tax=Pelagibacterium xiamenense TaxID=2901140 RepID=UPI001E458032|nr:phosphoribosylglycinamide formyltransferase [Pelagibacterium xiamenense]MCD7061146.1 phosphoribosylglycinamide formyltransferase [Pelagibacterium xiamenense]
MSGKKRVAILISGRGSNMTALIEAARNADYPAQIVGVFSNRAAAPGLEYARAEGIPTATLAQSKFETRLDFENALTAILEGWRVDYVCLAGFMRILTREFTTRWLGKAINIHPSLLPKYKGLDTHARAIAAGDLEHGCSVHFVTPGLDEGPVIAQARVPIQPGDTPEVLAARVLVEEHKLYPRALGMLAAGEIALDTGLNKVRPLDA